MSSKVIMSGAGVPAHILRVMPILTPIRGAGPLGSQIEIPLCTLDRQAHMLMLGMSGGEAVYVINTEMRVAPVSTFLQGYFLGQVTTEVYRRTAWIVPASKVMMALSMGMAVGMFGAIGTAANMVVMAGKAAALASRHPNEVRILWEMLPVAGRSLSWFRKNCPVLYGKMSAVVGAGVWEVLKSAPSGISAEDVANLAGRLIGGASAAHGAGLAALAKLMIKTIGFYSAIHLAPAAGHGALHSAQRIADGVVAELRKQGANINANELRQIGLELAHSAVEAKQNFDQLHQALQRIAPALEALVADFNSSKN